MRKWTGVVCGIVNRIIDVARCFVVSLGGNSQSFLYLPRAAWRYSGLGAEEQFGVLVAWASDKGVVIAPLSHMPECSPNARRNVGVEVTGSVAGKSVDRIDIEADGIWMPHLLIQRFCVQGMQRTDTIFVFAEKPVEHWDSERAYSLFQLRRIGG